MANILDDLQTYIAAEFPTEDIRKGFLPTAPDRVVGLIERAGDEPPAETFVGTGKGPKLHMEKPNIQILVRAVPDDYEASRNLADSLYQALHNLVGVTLSGTRYAAIEALQPPFNVGIDEQGRHLLGFNIMCWKRPN